MSGLGACVVTFANIKGGVGKTTAVVNIAYLLGKEFGKKVLVIDADDQGNATKALGVRDDFDREEQTLWKALKERLGYRRVMVESPCENVWVIPATKELKGAQLAFGQSARGMKMFVRLLKGAERDFDYVLIDTKPQINVLLQAALIASQWYVVPSFPESDSYDGFVDLLAESEEIFEEANEDLKCLGVLFTNVKKSPAHEAYIEFMKRHLRKAQVPVIKTMIRHSNAISTGSLHSCPAVSISSSRNTTEDYLKVTRQFLKRSMVEVDLPRPNLEVLGLGAGLDFVPAVAVKDDSNQEILF